MIVSFKQWRFMISYPWVFVNSIMKRSFVMKEFPHFFKYINKIYDYCGFGRSNLVLQIWFLLFTIFVVIVMIFSYEFFDSYFNHSMDGYNFNKEKESMYFNSSFLASSYEDKIVVSEILPNCGIQHACGDDEFPVHVYTGQDKDDQPKLCVGGKYVHGVGRGLNIAVIESRHARFKSLRNFDLYSQNSSALEAWLEHDLDQDDIIIAFTFDEASKELSKNAKEILYFLGSGKIQDLQFRCQWYMISQKGMRGFSPLEEITYGKSLRWGKVIDKKLCVSKHIQPLMVSPDPWPRANPLREQLCEICPELRSDRFCNDMDKHDVLIPSQLTDRSLLGNPVFSTPIIIVPGTSLSSLSLTLETLLYQPGIQPEAVFIIHTQNQIYIPVLAKVFGYKSLTVNSSFPLTTNDKIELGLSHIVENYHDKEFSIVLEEGLILAPDFLYFMAQLAPLLREDDSLLGISAWNPYGYDGTSGNPNIAFRSEDFPGMGFLLRTSTFINHMKGRMSQCCAQKSFAGWKIDGDILIPDVSRVLRRPRDYYNRRRRDNEFYIFTTPRVTNRDSTAWIERPNDLLLENYDNAVMALVNSSISIRINQDDLINCANSSSPIIRIIKELRNKIISIFYTEIHPESNDVLKSHLRCFNITVSSQLRVHNLYKKMLRLTVHSNTVMFIETGSIFAAKSNL